MSIRRIHVPTNDMWQQEVAVAVAVAAAAEEASRVAATAIYTMKIAMGLTFVASLARTSMACKEATTLTDSDMEGSLTWRGHFSI